MKVTVDVNAKVEVPQVNKLSIYRVSALKIKQDFLNRVRKRLRRILLTMRGIRQKAEQSL